MKFIKDIIGEKRERVRLDGSAAATAEPVQPPEEDTGSRAPLSLGHGFRLDPDQVPPAAAAPLPEDVRDPLAAPGTILAEDAAEASGSFGGNAPDEDAIAAFFAREQSQTAAPSAQDRPDPAAFFTAPDLNTAEAAPAERPEEDFLAPHGEEAEEDTAEPLGAEPDFSRLQQPDPAAETGRPYRVFTRSNAAGPDPDTAAGRAGTTPAAPAPAPAALPEVQPDPEPLPEPELARTPIDVQASVSPPETPVQQAAPAPVPQPAPEEPQAAAPQTPDAAPIDVPAPSMGRGASRAGRVKTRLLGFSPAQAAGADPFARSSEAAAPGYTQFPVGWLAIVQGPGRGAAFTLFSGVTVIGRGEDQTVRLDFGDNSISRDNHAAIAFDPEQKAFFIGHGGKANLVRRNGRPVLSTEELSAGDVIRIGETTLRFVPLCGADFGWDQPQHSDAADAAYR